MPNETSFPTASILSMSTPLLARQSRKSPSGAYELVYQDDGNLVLYDAGRKPLWASNTWGKTAGKVVLQEDGDLVVSDGNGAGVWQASTAGGKVGAQYRDSHLRVTDDGNIVVHAADGSVVWSRNPAQPLPPPGNFWNLQTLLAGGKLGAEQSNGALPNLTDTVCPYTVGNRAYLFVHGTDRRWTTYEVLGGGKLGPALQSGNFDAFYRTAVACGGTKLLLHRADRGILFLDMHADGTLAVSNLGYFDAAYEVVVPYSVGGRQYVFLQRSTGVWRTAEITGFDSITWLQMGMLPFSPVAAPYTLAGRAYVFLHRPDKGWSIVELKADGFVGPENRGTWGNYYPVIMPFTIEGRAFMLEHRADRAWCIDELLADGKLGSEMASGTMKNLYARLMPVTVGDVTYALGAAAQGVPESVPAQPSVPPAAPSALPIFPAASTLQVGGTLPCGQSIRSPNGAYKFALSASGSLELSAADGTLVWSERTQLCFPNDASGGKVALNTTNAMTVQDKSGLVVWRSLDHGGKPGEVGHLRVTDDGNVALYALECHVLWSAKPAQPINDTVVAEQSRTSKSGNLTVKLQSDGNLVLTDRYGSVRWAAGTNGSGAVLARVQDDGDLVLLDASAAIVWQASKKGGKTDASYRGSFLYLDDNTAQLQVRAPNQTMVWGEPPVAPAAPSYPASSTLMMGEPLLPTGSRKSPNGIYEFVYQADGNLVLYGANRAALWSSNTWNRSTSKTILQEDGDLVVLDGTGARIWQASAYSGKVGAQYRGSHLRVTDDGNVIVYAPDGSVVWSRSAAQPLPGPLQASTPASTPAVTSTIPSVTANTAALAAVTKPKFSVFGVDVDVPFEFTGDVKEEVRDALSWSGKGKLLWPTTVTVDPLVVSAWTVPGKDAQGKETKTPAAALKFGMPKSQALSDMMNANLARMPNELKVVANTVLSPYLALFNNSVVILATAKGVDNVQGPFTRGFNVYATVKVSEISPFNYLHAALPSLGLDTYSLKFNMSVTPSPIEMAVGGTLQINKKLDPLPLTIVSLGVKASLATTSTGLGATCSYVLDLFGEHVKFSGGINVTMGPKGNEATMWGALENTGPSKGWTEPFGIKYLVIDEMGIEVCPAPLVIAVRGGFHFGAGLDGSPDALFGGSLAVRADTGKPDNNMLELRSKEGLQLPRLIKALTGGLLDVKRVLDVNITDLYLYYAKENVKIAGKAYEPGMALSFKLDLWGFKAFVDGKFDDKGTGELRGGVDPIALGLAGVDLVKMTSVDGSTGANLYIKSDLPSFAGKITGKFVALGGLYSQAVDVVVGADGLTASLANDGVFSRDLMQLRIGPNGVGMTYGASWGPDVTVLGFPFRLTVGAAIESVMKLSTFSQKVTFTATFIDKKFSASMQFNARPIDGWDALQSCWDSATDLLGAITKYLLENIDIAVQWLMDKAKRTYDAICKALDAAGAALGAVATSVVKFFEAGVDDVFNAVGASAKEAADALKNAFNASVQFATQCLDALGHPEETIENVLKDVHYAADSVSNAVSDFITDLIGRGDGGHGTFVTPLMLGGKLAKGDTYNEKWSNWWPSITTYQVGDKTWLLGHRDAANGQWFVQQLLANGKLDHELPRGDFGKFYSSVVPYRTRSSGLQQYLFLHDRDSYQIRAVGPDGRPGKDVASQGNLTMFLPADSRTSDDRIHGCMTAVSFDSGRTVLIAQGPQKKLRMFELDGGRVTKFLHQTTLSYEYTSLTTADVRGQRFLIAWNLDRVDVYGPLNDTTLNVTCTYPQTYSGITVKAVFPFSVGGKSFLFIHDSANECVVRRMYMNGSVDWANPVYRETYDHDYERMFACRVGDLVFCFGHNED